MDKFISSIDEQLGTNQNKNTFADDSTVLQFVNESVKLIPNIEELNPNSGMFIINYVTDKALEKFCRLNQYYSFNSKSKKKLRTTYSELFNIIKAQEMSFDNISKEHHKRLNVLRKASNQFAEIVYSIAKEKLIPIVC